MHAMYALMNTWLMTTRADGSLDAANGGQHAISCHASAGIIYVLMQNHSWEACLCVRHVCTNEHMLNDNKGGR